MLLYFFIIFSIYYIFIVVIYFGWMQKRHKEQINDFANSPFISVIIAVRNEAENIGRLIQSLENQSYPKSIFEVIFVNDKSTDSTTEIIKEQQSKRRLNIQLLENKLKEGSYSSPKKMALLTGIEHAKGDLLVLTDGDCWFEKGWLKSIIGPFSKDEVQFVSGPVALEGNNSLFSHIQTIEFASLMSSGGAMINLKYPLMCNGANLAFRKSAFNEVNGYGEILENPSGDDVFLMQKINKKFPGSIRFVKDKNAIVKSKTHEKITDLINQRRRWASKWNKHLLTLSWLLPVFLFIHYASFIASVVYAIANPTNAGAVVLLIFIKFLLDYLLLNNALKFSSFRLRKFAFLISEILYPFYAFYFAITAQIGNYLWKDRSFKI